MYVTLLQSLKSWSNFNQSCTRINFNLGRAGNSSSVKENCAERMAYKLLEAFIHVKIFDCII